MSTNYFNFGKGLEDEKILFLLDKIGIKTVTEDLQEVELKY